MSSKDFSHPSTERRYPSRELGVKASILRAVLDSEGLRRWLLPHIRAKGQAKTGLGIAQSTVNRIVNQDEYDFKVSTLVKIARTFGFVRLSEFLSHVELELQKGHDKNSLQMNYPVTPVRDKSTASTPIDRGGSHDSIGVSQSDLRRAVKDVLILTAAGITDEQLELGTITGTAPAERQTRKSQHRKNKRGAGGR